MIRTITLTTLCIYEAKRQAYCKANHVKDLVIVSYVDKVSVFVDSE